MNGYKIQKSPIIFAIPGNRAHYPKTLFDYNFDHSSGPVQYRSRVRFKQLLRDTVPIKKPML